MLHKQTYLTCLSGTVKVTKKGKKSNLKSADRPMSYSWANIKCDFQFHFFALFFTIGLFRFFFVFSPAACNQFPWIDKWMTGGNK